MPHVITTNLAQMLELNESNWIVAHDILSFVYEGNNPFDAKSEYQLALIATNTFNKELPQQRIGLVASSGELAVLNNGQLERYYVIKETLEGTLDTLLQVLYESVHETEMMQAEKRQEWQLEDVLKLMGIIRTLSDKMSVCDFGCFVEPFLNYIPMDTLYSLDAHQEQDSAGNSLLTLPQESLKSADGVPMAFSLVDGELTFGNDTFLQANE